MTLSFSYNTHEDGSVTITGLSGSIWDRVVVPDEIDGHPVTAIGNSAFMSKNDLSLITLPDTVLSIGNQAFNFCHWLWNVRLPEHLFSIGTFAFSFCDHLPEIRLPDTVMEIGDWAFYGCGSLRSIHLPDSIEAIRKNTFSGCSSLSESRLSPAVPLSKRSFTPVRKRIGRRSGSAAGTNRCTLREKHNMYQNSICEK